MRPEYTPTVGSVRHEWEHAPSHLGEPCRRDPVRHRAHTERASEAVRRPTDPELVKWGSRDLNYALHVGMYSYSSGLERLCKLAIACNEYATTGEFPKLRAYSHRIGALLDAVETLTTPTTGPDPSEREAKYLVRPVEGLDPDLMGTVERFASGAGRYEHLDIL